MRSSHSLDRIGTRFDDGRLIADAGLLLPATLAQHLGLQELFDQHVSLGANPGRAHVGAKALTLIMSALAGGDCIDDADALRSGGTQVYFPVVNETGSSRCTDLLQPPLEVAQCWNVLEAVEGRAVVPFGRSDSARVPPCAIDLSSQSRRPPGTTL